MFNKNNLHSSWHNSSYYHHSFEDKEEIVVRVSSFVNDKSYFLDLVSYTKFLIRKLGCPVEGRLSYADEDNKGDNFYQLENIIQDSSFSFAKNTTANTRRVFDGIKASIISNNTFNDKDKVLPFEGRWVRIIILHPDSDDSSVEPTFPNKVPRKSSKSSIDKDVNTEKKKKKKITSNNIINNSISRTKTPKVSVLNNRRSYSTNTTSNAVFSELSARLKGNFSVANKETQLEIEKYLFDYKQVEFNVNKTPNVHGIDMQKLGSGVGKIVESKTPIMKEYITNLFHYEVPKRGRVKQNEFIQDVLQTIGISYMYNLSVYSMLEIATFVNSEHDDRVQVLPMSIKIGKEMMKKYFSVLKTDSDIEKFSIWKTEWKKLNKEFDEIIDDSFYSLLGSKILTVLTHSDLIGFRVNTYGITQKRNEFYIVDPDLAKISKGKMTQVIPFKLPMISPPKIFDEYHSGGYLLNDDYYQEDIFTERRTFQKSSEISHENNLYSLVNNVSRTPFRINTELLDFITDDSHSGLDMLISDKELSKYDNEVKLTKYKKDKLKSLNSKYAHQGFVLSIAELLRDYSSIYFPLKLDHRGRVYCNTAYFNYQSNDLAKSLILFSEPGIVSKSDLSSIEYLKSYGVNCFGGAVSKGSIKDKQDWVDTNEYNIINYDNEILISKAKEKLLFLSFCIEYKRFVEFYKDDHQTEFKTYLPIQVDATCNGFQHLALLSTESKLFSTLNLTNEDNSKYPRDFYTFLVNKVYNYLDNKIKFKDLYRPLKSGMASYERLRNFGWNRNHLKKLIMTIPYNASNSSKIKYVKQELHQLDYSSDQKCYWYTLSENGGGDKVNDFDVSLLVSIVQEIIEVDFHRIGKLNSYLKNVANLCNYLSIPIYWTLPTGLKIYQSYFSTKSITISPFAYDKVKFNLQVINKKSLDKNKQIRSLMPNLIHSLDASSLTELYYYFSLGKENCRFYSVHDCFGTTCDQVYHLKSCLVYVYVELYSNTHYLERFDQNIIKHIETTTGREFGEDRVISLDNDQTYKLHDIKWVTNQTLVNEQEIRKIDNQFILI